MESPKSKYSTDDAGVMIALSSLPFVNQDDFIKKEFKTGLFKKYKESIEKNFTNANGNEEWQQYKQDFNDYFYECRAYCLLGRFDVALISLVDDFEFASRHFQPFNPILFDPADPNNTSADSYDYQLISGPTPILDLTVAEEEKSNKQKRSKLLNQAKATFLKNEAEIGHFPIISICQLKLNNSLLIGAGGIFTKYVLLLIQQLIEDHKKTKLPNGVQLEALLLESFGFHELTILFFSNSVVEIAKLIMVIKESVLSHLHENEIMAKGHYDLMKKSTLCNGVFEELKETLFTDSDDFDHSHLFVGVTATYGYDFDIFKEMTNIKKPWKEVMLPFYENDQISLNTKWNVRPGHTMEMLEKLGNNKKKEYVVSPGESGFQIHLSNKADLEYQNDPPDEEKKWISAQEAFTGLLEPIIDIWQHTRKMRSNPEIVLQGAFIRELKNYDKGKHIYFHKALKNLIFYLKNLKDLDANLRKIGAHKVISNRIRGIYSHFNTMIQDNMLYGFFLDLRGFLEEKVTKTIDEYSKRVGEEGYETVTVNNNLFKLSEICVQAHDNRFFSSHRFSELAEFYAD